DDTQALQTVVRSFRLLSPAKAVETPDPSRLFDVGVLILVLLVCWPINRISATPRVNGGLIAAVIIALLLGLRIVVLGGRSASSFEIGETVGHSLLPLLVAIALGVHFARRRRRIDQPCPDFRSREALR